MRVDGRRPHSGPYSHGGHSSRQRHDNRGTEGGRQILWPLHPLVLQDRVYHCPNPLEAEGQGSPLRQSMWVILPDHRQQSGTENVGGQRKKNQSRSRLHCPRLIFPSSSKFFRIQNALSLLSPN